MKFRACFLVIFLASFLGSSECGAVFRFANIYGNHMVLQQAPLQAKIWGFGEVGQRVFLRLGYEYYRSTITQGANNTGIWSITLKPVKSNAPHTIRTVSKVNGTKVSAKLKDVLFGDVWICSGQSNMEFPVRVSDYGHTAIKEAENYDLIRLFTTKRSTSETPLDELNGIVHRWTRTSPRTVRDFSAVCWYYGTKLYDKLQYPIGLVVSSWGGTFIESWSSPDVLQKCDVGEDIMTEEGLQTQSKITNNLEALKPSTLWNAMIYPFLKMTIYGVIWYQGESNSRYGLYSYDCTFPNMIDDWRSKWAAQSNTDESFPFGFVQLSAFGKTTTTTFWRFAELRWNQTVQHGYVPNKRQRKVFMAVAMDLGNPNSPYTSIHPTDKIDVGTRLSLGGLSVAYGQTVYYLGPLVFEIKQVKQPPSLELEVVFTSVLENIEVRSFTGFEVYCDESSEWIKAQITKHYPKSVIIVPSVDCSITAVRYAWSDYPCAFKECAIYSSSLPSPPFIKYGPF